MALRRGSRVGLADERVHGDIRGERAGVYEQVYHLVRRIPRGRIMTYGQLAKLIENRLSPRAVGWAMHGCPDGVPWQRVVNASGGCSTDRLPDLPDGLQRAMLESEGVEFRENGTLEVERYRWTPPEHRPGGGSSARRNGGSRRR
jgi:methylated-DNA-protein-cysteine methyltransferase-like protein